MTVSTLTDTARSLKLFPEVRSGGGALLMLDTGPMADQWAQWLLDRRFGGDQAAKDRIFPQLREYRDRVLEGARIKQTDTVLDVGCGDGLLGLRALQLTNDTVIFSDISRDLLDRCQHSVQEFDARERAEFVQCGLPELEPIPDESVDVAMTRSVLIYVEDKARAFHALYRVLRDGGRLSIFEPINRFGWPEADNVLWGCDVGGLESLAHKVKGTYRQHTPDRNPMIDFDERDLLALAEAAGFGTVRLEYQASVGPAEESVSWATFLRMSPNPLVPTFGEVLAEALGEGEDYGRLAGRLEAELPRRRSRRAGAFLTATR